jgi:hypothetical protein
MFALANEALVWGDAIVSPAARVVAGVDVSGAVRNEERFRSLMGFSGSLRSAMPAPVSESDWVYIHPDGEIISALESRSDAARGAFHPVA